MIKPYKTLMNVGLLLAVAWGLSGCGSKITPIRVLTISTLSPPTIRPIENIKLIEKPDPYIVTVDEYKYYIETCESYEFAGREGHDTADEIFADTGLTKQDACEFAVYGLPTHKWLNMEADINTTVSYIEKLRAQLNDAYLQLVERYRIANSSSQEIKNQLQKP